MKLLCPTSHAGILVAIKKFNALWQVVCEENSATPKPIEFAVAPLVSIEEQIAKHLPNIHASMKIISTPLSIEREYEKTQVCFFGVLLEYGENDKIPFSHARIFPEALRSPQSRELKLACFRLWQHLMPGSETDILAIEHPSPLV